MQTKNINTKPKRKSKITTKAFIEKAKNKHGDKYDYSQIVYIDRTTPLKIMCNTHKEFFNQLPNNHILNGGCFKCRSESRSLSQVWDTEKFTNKAKSIHGDTYDYSYVNYVNSKTKVDIFCKQPNHGIFSTSPSSHISQKIGCPTCGLIKSANSRKNTIEEFIYRSNIIHNNKYDYSESIYVKGNKKVIINCPKHTRFLQTPNAHLRGDGCKGCSKLTFRAKMSHDTDQFVLKSKKIHGDKYDYSNSIYVNTETKIDIKCNKHGIFSTTPHSHISMKSGCPKCQRCPSCQLWNTNGRICVYCKPKSQNKLYQKTKEMQVVNFLQTQLPNNKFIHNKSVGNECRKTHLFPDILYNCNTYNLIVEIDEYKHRGSGYECDERRMYEIIAELGMPCVFIRYNPDDKKSDKNILLEKVKEYLNLDLTTKTPKDYGFDDFGFKVEYLFY